MSSMSKSLEIERKAHDDYYAELMEKAQEALSAGACRQEVLDDLHFAYKEALVRTDASYANPSSTPEDRATWKGRQTAALTAMEEVAAE